MNNYLKEYEKNLTNYHVRQELVIKYSWAIPNNNAIQEITKYSPLVEIGAGTGYWGYLINKSGGKILCFDKYVNENPYGHQIQYLPVHNGAEEVLEKLHHSINLFLCWPPYDNDMAINSLLSFKGKYLIYIGESYNGCTASDKFFEELDKYWVIIHDILIPQWDGLHDYLYIYKRRK
jgi:hypothetical protein